MEKITCKTCGKEFEAWPSARRKYCSAECAYRDKDRVAPSIAKNKKVYPDKTCPTCGTVFPVDCHTVRRTYCQIGCSPKVKANAKKQAAALAAKPKESARTAVECKVCKKEFQTYINAPATYCSRACAKADPELIQTRTKTRQANGSYGPGKIYSTSKRGRRKGTFFRSRMEANFAAYLDFKGVRWEYEPTVFRFPVKRGVVSYTPDFYLPDEDRYIETKGWMNDRSRIQIKRMAIHYPKIKLDVVTWEEYKKLGKEYASQIPGWEYGKDGKPY